MVFYRRNLPHWHPGGKALFITWRLHAAIDDQHYLARPEIAGIVADALTYGKTELHHYELIAWVVMSNHVHVLLLPLVEVRALMKRIKGFTARRSNEVAPVARPELLHLSFSLAAAPVWRPELPPTVATEYLENLFLLIALPLRGFLPAQPATLASGR